MRSQMGGILSILRLSNGKLLDGNKEVTLRKDGWVMLAVDTSGSMAHTLEEAKKHAVTFYQTALDRSYRTGVVGFADYARLYHGLDCEGHNLEANLREMVAGGGTAMAEGLGLAATYLDCMNGERAIVLITDGQPSEPDKTLRVAEKIKAKGTRIICIGVTGASLAFLQQIASAPDLADLVAAPLLGETIERSVGLLSWHGKK